jgi:hypothetical protein
MSAKTAQDRYQRLSKRQYNGYVPPEWDDLIEFMRQGVPDLLAELARVQDERRQYADRLSDIRTRVAVDAAKCVGCKDPAFRHWLSCDVMRIADVPGDYEPKP